MLQFHNTFTRKKEEFKPIDKENVKLYTCGPTVYNYAHIGNFRAYIFEDILKRYLKYKGYKVTHVMNLTDVEDKIIATAEKEGKHINDVTAPFIEAFFKNLEDLNIEKADKYPKATDHIPEMLEIIKLLEEKGHVYEKDGSIYFNIASYPEYGKLAHLDVEGLQAGARGDADEYDKDNARDFAVWKGVKPGEHYWESDWGKGRPGWHIECSAMSRKYLGDSFDIHCGGVDNIFPHHENEIAQSECATGHKFVNYWLHCEHLIVDNQKMSKSKGNFFTLEQLLEKGEDKRAIRYLLMATQYRKRLNFTFEALKAASTSINRLDELIRRLNEETFAEGSSDEAVKTLELAEKEFEAGMDDDLNISAGLAAVFNLLKEINSLADAGKLLKADAEATLALLQKFDSVLGVMNFEADELDDEEIIALIEKRTEARKSRDWAESDRIRDELAEKGIILQDSPEGVRWRRK